MKKEDIQLGGTYLAKITDKVVPVRLDAERPASGGGGWDATNLATNKKVRIKSAAKLRGPAPRTAEKEKARATAAADQENARLRDEREASADGMTASERAMEESAPKGKRKTGTPRKPAKAEVTDKPKRTSLIDAAVEVLRDAGQPMNCKTIVEQVVAKGLWSSAKGKTPEATLYSAVLREIKAKGTSARFVKADRGHFTLAKGV